MGRERPVKDEMGDRRVCVCVCSGNKLDLPWALKHLQIIVGSNFRNSSGEWVNEYWCFHHFGFNYMSHSAQSSFYSANLDWDPSRLSPIFHFPPLLLSSLHPINPFVEKKRKEKNLHVCDFLALQRMKPSFILIIAAQWIHAILATLFSISPNLHTA